MSYLISPDPWLFSYLNNRQVENQQQQRLSGENTFPARSLGRAALNERQVTGCRHSTDTTSTSETTLQYHLKCFL